MTSPGRDLGRSLYVGPVDFHSQTGKLTFFCHVSWIFIVCWSATVAEREWFEISLTRLPRRFYLEVETGRYRKKRRGLKPFSGRFSQIDLTGGGVVD